MKTERERIYFAPTTKYETCGEASFLTRCSDCILAINLRELDRQRQDLDAARAKRLALEAEDEARARRRRESA